MTHIRQIGTSACGPTALINVMVCGKIPKEFFFNEVQQLQSCVWSTGELFKYTVHFQ